jgi:hypothetical protein
MNILSFDDVEDDYDIMYIPRTAFIVHLPDRSPSIAVVNYT